MQSKLDELYAQSKEGFVFKNLMEIIRSDKNIKLAYRNIKNNSGSHTAGVDRKTISFIENFDEESYVRKVRAKIANYNPKAVKRVDIPKPDGRTRPLGIPAIWDRIVQQCILQPLRGLDEQPTIHEGVTARALEKKGIVSERCEIHRQIRKDNALLRRLKKMVTEMIRKIRGSVTNITENLEVNWMYMVEAQYHLTLIRNEKQDILNQLEPILDDYEQYVRIQDQIRKLIAQRDKLIAQRKATPILQIRRRNELAEQIDSLTRQLEGRRKAKENNPNECKSVRVFLERESRKDASYTIIPAKKRGHDER